MQKPSPSYVYPVSSADPAAHVYRRDRYHFGQIFEIEGRRYPNITVHSGLDAPFSVTATEATDEFIYKRSLDHIRRDRADYYILCAILSGSVKILYGGHRSLMAAGDFVLVRSNVPYEMIVDPGTDDKYCQICISLPPDQIEALNLTDIAGVPIAFDGDGPRLVQELIRTLFRHGATVSAPLANSLVATILLGVSQMADGISRPATRKATVRDARRDAILAYLDSHCTNPDLCASMVAGACRISVRYMSRLLSEQRASFSELVRARRLERMRSWLSDPALDDETIASLAYRAGFNSVPHCILSFRKQFGYPPGRFRERQRALRVR